MSRDCPKMKNRKVDVGETGTANVAKAEDDCDGDFYFALVATDELVD